MQINDYGRNLSLVVFSYYLIINLFLFPFNLCDATVFLRSLKAMEILDLLLSTTDIEIPFGKSNFNFSCQRFLEFSFGLHSWVKNSQGQSTKFDKFWAFIYWQKNLYAWGKMILNKPISHRQAHLYRHDFKINSKIKLLTSSRMILPFTTKFTCYVQYNHIHQGATN